MPTKKPFSFEGVHYFLKTLFADDLHAKRVLSLAGATSGVIESASLAVAMIGQGLALARGRPTKHAIKQVDRLLSNPVLSGLAPTCMACAFGQAAACGYAASRMPSAVVVRRRNCSLRRSAGTCWCWRVRRRRKWRSSS